MYNVRTKEAMNAVHARQPEVLSNPLHSTTTKGSSPSSGGDHAQHVHHKNYAPKSKFNTVYISMYMYTTLGRLQVYNVNK